MKWYTTYARKQAFTLIELLVVIAIIGILFTLVSPQLGKARLKGKLTQQAARARYIIEAITAKESGSRFSSGWPKTGDANTSSSTAFLVSLVEEGYLDVDYAFFAGPGMTPAKNKSEFENNPDEHNAWCILRDLTDATPGNVPAVYLKNLDIGSMTFAEDAVPLGNKGFAFATKNGEAIVVEQGDMNNRDDFSSIFNVEKITNLQVMKP